MIGYKDNFSSKLQLLLGADNVHFMNNWWPLLIKMKDAKIPDGFEQKLSEDKAKTKVASKQVKAIISSKIQPGLLKVSDQVAK